MGVNALSVCSARVRGEAAGSGVTGSLDAVPTSPAASVMGAALEEQPKSAPGTVCIARVWVR